MNPITARKLTPDEIMKEGWQALVKHFGYTYATAFLMSIEKGEGDSVEELGRRWDDRSVQEVHEEIMKWKEANRLRR